ncbi:MAG: hypothetical protein PWQ08_893 [Clostridiales bacterium]|nr:hypothetical protein [Clostridiales bacterium]
MKEDNEQVGTRGISFRLRAYFCLLLLFLVAFNTALFAITWRADNQTFLARRDKLLTQQQYMLRALSADISNIAATRPQGLGRLYEKKGQDFLAGGVLLRIEKNNDVVYTSFDNEPYAQLSPAVGATVWRARQVEGHGKMLLVQSALSQELAGYQVLMAFPFQSFFDLWFADLRSIAAISFGVSLALAAALWLLLRVLWQPLAQLGDATRRLQAGETQVRVACTRKDEIGQLAQDFNRMADQIESQILTLQTIAQEKQSLLDALSHELRTPLTAVRASVQLLQMAKLSQGETYAILEGLQHETGRLQQLADSMLSLSRLERESAGQFVAVSSGKLCRRAAQLFRAQCAAEGIAFSLNLKDEQLFWGDEALLESLLCNLLDNACKACSARVDSELGEYQPQIDLWAQRQGKTFVLCVADNGCGMGEEALRHIKEPFYREDKARSRRTGGNGLGVPICQRIVKAHGATLSFKSTPGYGTMALVTFTT